MKKFLALLLAMMMVLSLVACGGETSSNNGENPSTSSQSGENNDNNSAEDNKSNTEEESKITFEEIVVVDNDECVIKITEIDPDNMWGFSLKAQLENKSADKTYMFSVESAAINGVQCDPFFASEVAAGKKLMRKSVFPTALLKKMELVNFLILN